MGINAFIHHVTQILSITLAFVWFGWQAGVLVFLINWAANTEKYTNDSYRHTVR